MRDLNVLLTAACDSCLLLLLLQFWRHPTVSERSTFSVDSCEAVQLTILLFIFLGTASVQTILMSHQQVAKISSFASLTEPPFWND